MAKPVVVVGAGLAGLVCARRLHQARVPVLLVEAADRVGGRLRTEIVDGFRLDRGFQVLFTAYPSAREELDFPKLNLRRFEPGAQIYHQGKLYSVNKDDPLQAIASTYLTLSDKLRILDLTWECRGISVQQIWRQPDMPTERFLRQMGLSNEFLERFARPFFGGIFMDRDLQVSRRMFQYVWKMLSEGDTVLPALGISAIPEQIADDLPATAIRLNTRVKSIDTGRKPSVTTATGEKIDAAAVVIATEAPEAERLSGFETPKGARGQVCLHFDAPVAPTDSSLIVLRSGPGRTNMVVPMSNIAPDLAPYGKHLVCATILGDSDETDGHLADLVRKEVAAWFPLGRVPEWRLLRVDRIPYSQFAQPPGFNNHLPGNTPGRDNLYFAGEFTVSSSIQGALESGAECAALLLQDLGRLAV